MPQTLLQLFQLNVEMHYHINIQVWISLQGSELVIFSQSQCQINSFDASFVDLKIQCRLVRTKYCSMHHYRLPASLLTLMNKFLLVPLIWSPKNIIDSICRFSEHRLISEHYLSSVSFSKDFIQFAKAKRFFLCSSVRVYTTACLQNLQPHSAQVQLIVDRVSLTQHCLKIYYDI
ncbi:Hypothetical_protein [Hexamita inflata]|uniref:Hypothetical_protein n=1 Tax=Hexamita inflata TaxID=28002 RepID=A0ABP1K1B8_9EUKA